MPGCVGIRETALSRERTLGSHIRHTTGIRGVCSGFTPRCRIAADSIPAFAGTVQSGAFPIPCLEGDRVASQTACGRTDKPAEWTPRTNLWYTALQAAPGPPKRHTLRCPMLSRQARVDSDTTSQEGLTGMAPTQHLPRQAKTWRWRQDVRVFVRLFPWPATASLVAGTALIAATFQFVYNAHQATHRLPLEGAPLTYIQAVYAVLNMMFLQVAYTDVPSAPALAAFFALVPIVGLTLFSIFGFNALRLIRVFFVRRERGPEWQEVLASTLRRPILVAGLGRVGYRVARQLAVFGQPLVGIEREPSALTAALMEAGVPVLLGDVRAEDILEKAGLARAATIVACTDDDMTNLGLAFAARDPRENPALRLVLRIFDDELRERLGAWFEEGEIISRSAISAPVFISQAVGVDVLESFPLDGRNVALCRIPVCRGSSLEGQSVGDLTREGMTVAFHLRSGCLTVEPFLDMCLEPGDDLFAFLDSDQLPTILAHTSRSGLVLVCGLGHVGYRTAEGLHALQRRVVALDSRESSLGQRLADAGITVRVADFRQRRALLDAGIDRAEAVVICSSEDLTNLEAALQARELNPEARLVVRIFDEDLGRRLAQALGFDAVISTSAVAAPAFVSAALGVHLTQMVDIAGQTFHLARLRVAPASGLNHMPVAALHAEDDLTVVLHARHNRVDIPPGPGAVLQKDDEVVVLATQHKLGDLSQRNQPRRADAA
jgi:Trk K+ transport system NAD-binding subunit